MKMHTTLVNWLEELENETKICVSDEICEEAQSNMVSFGFNEELLKQWSKEAVREFLRACSNLYQRKSNQAKIVFYAWLDEQAHQIRISAVSRAHDKLPFGCNVTKSDLDQVVNGVYSDDSGLYTKGSLDVWCRDI